MEQIILRDPIFSSLRQIDLFIEITSLLPIALRDLRQTKVPVEEAPNPQFWLGVRGLLRQDLRDLIGYLIADPLPAANVCVNRTN
jgi:hypothetical protein